MEQASLLLISSKFFNIASSEKTKETCV